VAAGEATGFQVLSSRNAFISRLCLAPADRAPGALDREVCGCVLPLIQGVSSVGAGGRTEGYPLLRVSVLMAFHAVVIAPNADSALLADGEFAATDRDRTTSSGAEGESPGAAWRPLPEAAEPRRAGQVHCPAAVH
jgi:hypothetical protein